MKQQAKVLLILVVLQLAARTVLAECNACNALTNTVCISKTQFQNCRDNAAFGVTYECNEGEFCSLLGRCSEDEELAECNDCGNCDASQTFACIDTTTFALCMGTDTPSEEIRAKCTAGNTCNINNPQICGAGPSSCSAEEDPVITTTPTTTTSTTPSPATDPNGFCASIQTEGRYPVGTNAATTCRQYVHCIQVSSGAWYGPVYNCPGATYYDSAKRYCVATVPSTCSNTVTSLSYRSILLE